LVWSDEFNHDGPPDPANWGYERGFIRNEELQWYQPENAYCTNGLLIIEARPERKLNPDYVAGSTHWKTSREWIDYTSASLTSRNLHEFKYGKFEMRARINTQPGSWPAFWVLGAARPSVGWPACGEIDIMEYYTGQIRANIAFQMNGKAKWSAVAKPVADLGGDAWSNAFHIWTMEWKATNIDLLVDGQLMNRFDVATADGADKGNPFHFPEYFILNQAIGSNGGDPAHTPFPIRFEVDWVRVYQLKN
jgi:beta-glucanase (GH16 family)